MPVASGKYFRKKLRDNSIDDESDEAILYQLHRHVDDFTLNDLATKIYFNETDLSMDPDTKMWLNLIIPGLFPNYHCHDYYEFNIIFEGRCIEIVNNREVILGKGDILILPSNFAFHTHYLKPRGRGCNLLVKSAYLTAIKNEFSGIRDNFLDSVMKRNGFCVIHSADCPDIADEIEELTGIYMEENKTQASSTPPSALSRLYVENTFKRMILKICKEMTVGRVVCIFSDLPQKAFSSEEILLYIHDNYASITMEELSKKFGYSQRQLARIIRKHSGNCFSALVSYARVMHAKNLLKNTSLSGAEIAKAVGLDSKEYFCTMFRRQTGMTPVAYRKLARKGV